MISERTCLQLVLGVSCLFFRFRSECCWYLLIPGLRTLCVEAWEISWLAGASLDSDSVFFVRLFFLRISGRLVCPGSDPFDGRAAIGVLRGRCGMLRRLCSSDVSYYVFTQSRNGRLLFSNRGWAAPFVHMLCPPRGDAATAGGTWVVSSSRFAFSGFASFFARALHGPTGVLRAVLRYEVLFGCMCFLCTGGHAHGFDGA